MIYILGITLIFLSVLGFYATSDKIVVELPAMLSDLRLQREKVRVVALLLGVVSIYPLANELNLVTSILGAAVTWMIVASFFVLFAPTFRSIFLYFGLSSAFLLIVILSNNL